MVSTAPRIKLAIGCSLLLCGLDSYDCMNYIDFSCSLPKGIYHPIQRLAFLPPNHLTTASPHIHVIGSSLFSCEPAVLSFFFQNFFGWLCSLPIMYTFVRYVYPLLHWSFPYPACALPISSYSPSPFISSLFP